MLLLLLLLRLLYLNGPGFGIAGTAGLTWPVFRKSECNAPASNRAEVTKKG